MTQVFYVAINSPQMYTTSLNYHITLGDYTGKYNSYYDSNGIGYVGDLPPVNQLVSSMSAALNLYNNLSSKPYAIVASAYQFYGTRGSTGSAVSTIQSSYFIPQIDQFPRAPNAFVTFQYPFPPYITPTVSGAPQIDGNQGVVGTDVDLQPLSAQNPVPDFVGDGISPYPYIYPYNNDPTQLIGHVNGAPVVIPEGYVIHGCPGYPSTPGAQKTLSANPVDSQPAGLIYYVGIYCPTGLFIPPGNLSNGLPGGMLGYDGLVNRCMISSGGTGIKLPTTLNPPTNGISADSSLVGIPDSIIGLAGSQLYLQNNTVSYINRVDTNDTDTQEDIDLISLTNIMVAKTYRSIQTLILTYPQLFVMHGEYLLLVYRYTKTKQLQI